VYLARQANVGNQVAIKFLPAHLADDADLRRRFEREAALTLQVTHPGAAQLLDAGQDEDGRLYLVFEFVEGDDLSTLLDRDGALAYDEAFAVTLKVAEALAYAHHKGVVHRDIKPENVVFTASGSPRILDFGLAKLSSASRDTSPEEEPTRSALLTEPGVISGTVGYMSPEQVRGQPIDGTCRGGARAGLRSVAGTDGRAARRAGRDQRIRGARQRRPVAGFRHVTLPRRPTTNRAVHHRRADTEHSWQVASATAIVAGAVAADAVRAKTSRALAVRRAG